MSDIRIKVIVDGQESIQTIDELNKSLDSFKKNTDVILEMVLKKLMILISQLKIYKKHLMVV
jgi:hypothetical protein